ncbi:nuclear factor, erythroid 2 like 2 S homeolog isoform X1 [Xenopus laevis]|uniref:Nuclear factor, erythroid 2 like 2 S homeolog isoform X1 n=1 Tax=Xenopus laevis TaxID=8355 RepID=A0A8J1LVZ8_XENLA|nr:nuclear factor, erythroid 2 like 2 S homeolog isoform X1 [Xenopus laevis]
MMEIEIPLPLQSQQDLDLIDILWKQDIDLGVSREVFDYNQRHKENELEKQKKLEKERQEQLQKEQEKALYAQLQLDEETGEFIPVQQATPIETTEVTQALATSIQDKPSAVHELSFDECLKILADTFQLGITNECLNNEIDNMVDLSMYPNPESITMTESPDTYSFLNPLSAIAKPHEINTSVVSNDFVDTFASSVPSVNTNAPFNVETFCDDIFTLVDPKVTNIVPLTNNSGQLLNELLNDNVDITDLSLCKAFNGSNQPEFNDSDSGVSVNTSPCATSPSQSIGGSAFDEPHYGYSDSDMEDMDSTPEAAQQKPPDNFIAPFTEDTYFTLSPFVSQDTDPFEIEAYDSPAKEIPASPGYSKAPFAKDKSLNRQEARFTRDTQRAKVLNIPFSVDKIVNLPVDSFNEMMSKYQFNKAQLALIRDIRRRGKNKVAAQNCRKRKMENIVELETDLDKLKYEKEKLLSERGAYNNSLSQMKKKLGTLYMEVFNKLQDENGKPYSPHEYSLQQTKEGNIFLVPKTKKVSIKKE